jgi:hypothetical protein
MVEPRQQLTIHSGAFKTATSAVQTILNKNADVLLREHGILIPQVFSRPLQGVHEEGARSHNQLGHLVQKARASNGGATERLHEGLVMLTEEIRASAAPNAVISSEMLTSIDEVSAGVIRDFLQQFDLRVVYSVRRVDEYIESLARQELKFRNTVQKVTPPYETPFTGLLAWSKVLGDEAMNILVYGYPSRQQAVFNTLRALGIEDPGTLAGGNPVRNPSLQADGLLVRRALARFATEIGHDVSDETLREAIVQRAYRWEAHLDALKPLLVYSKDERLAIFDATLPVHEEIARRFLNEEESDMFLARSEIEALTDQDLASWEATEVLSVVREMADFALKNLEIIAPRGHSIDRLRKEFRIARRRNAQLRDRIKELEAQLGVDSSPDRQNT